MNLPLILNYGLISLYRVSQADGTRGISAPPEFNFGSVYQISSYGVQYVQVGDKVLYNGRDVKCLLAFHGKQYPIIEEAKLVTIGIM